MTNSIEDRLRAALRDAPPVDVGPVPLEQIHRKARRRQALVAVSAAAALAVLVAGVVVGLPGMGSSRRGVPPVKSPTPSPSASTAAEQWLAGGVHGLTVDHDGQLWIVREEARHGRDRWHLAQQDGRFGDLSTETGNRFRIRGPVSQLSFGLGGLWTFGGGDGAYPNGHLSVLGYGPGPLTNVGDVLPRLPHAGISGLTFADGTPFAAIYGLNRVEAIPETKAFSPWYVSLPGSPTAIVTTLQGQIWVRVQTGSTSRLIHIVTSGGRLALGHDSFPWHGPILGADHGNDRAIWTSDSPHRIIEFDPALYAKGSASLAYVGDRLQVPGQAIRVIEDGSGGLYVAVDGGWDGATVGVAYYDANARLGSAPSPTAFLPTSQPVESIAHDPAGGVVFSTTDFAEFHWDPTAH